MRKILRLLFLLFISASASAQSTFGVRGGVNYSYMRVIFNFDDYRSLNPDDPVLPSGNGRQKASVTPLVRTSFGVFLQQNFTPKFSLREELLYQGQGCKNYNIDNAMRTDRIKLDYAMFPISFVWRVHPKLALSAGHYVAVLVHTQAGFVKLKDYGNTHDYDYGIQSAAEYSISNKIGVGLSYYYGLADSFPGSSVQRLRTGQLYLTYSFKSRPATN